MPITTNSNWLELILLTQLQPFNGSEIHLGRYYLNPLSSVHEVIVVNVAYRTIESTHFK